MNAKILADDNAEILFVVHLVELLLVYPIHIERVIIVKMKYLAFTCIEK